MRDFEADRRICDAATPGPWSATSAEICEAKENETGLRHNVIAGFVDGREKWFSRNDADFIAAARDGWPKALDRIAELEVELQNMRCENTLLMVTVKTVSDAVDNAKHHILKGGERYGYCE